MLKNAPKIQEADSLPKRMRFSLVLSSFSFSWSSTIDSLTTVAIEATLLSAVSGLAWHGISCLVIKNGILSSFACFI